MKKAAKEKSTPVTPRRSIKPTSRQGSIQKEEKEEKEEGGESEMLKEMEGLRKELE